MKFINSKFLPIFFSSLIAGFFVAISILAWNNPTATPPNGDSALYYASSTGNFGIGTTTPSSKLHLSGDNISLNIQSVTPAVETSIFSGSSGNVNRSTIFTTGSMLSFGTGGATRMSVLSNGNVGIGITDPGYTLTVNGTAWVTSGAWSGSDIRWKKNIKPLENSLSKLLQLQGVGFNWKKDEYPDLKFNDGPQIGFIAQDVEKIFPELVTTDNNGYKGISYEKIVPVLTEAIKELHVSLEQLKKENSELKIIICKDHPEEKICLK